MKKRRRLTPLGYFLVRMLLTSICLYFLDQFVFGLYRVNGNSMHPSMKDGDLCLLYKLEDYHVGDIVLYTKNNEKQIGRIVSMQGTFNIQEERPYQDGMMVMEEVFYPTFQGSWPLPVTLEKDQFWIMHDFRSDLKDSRSYGPIQKEALQGKVLFLFRRRGF